ncbi:DNA mismatch repair endonuclease MutH [Pleionea sediminis]|uniref:DNA mismatch repair endonuclease MutH n=1 Tax=Pleionea sediminis TaxID=2569479 RepID=UPI001FE26999|nr:DNA mismatch repair endonuclease MutH [Pleionea sediminis]
MSQRITPPKTTKELMTRAESLAGFKLSNIAEKYAAQLPETLKLEKGWIGQFIEFILGASSGSLPQPDFPNLGIELKTIPIDETGKPLESTYVSVVHLINNQGETWENSLVKRKLNHVLWVPIISTKNLAIKDRVVATPLLWQPTPEQEATLRSDWEETMEKVMLGELGQLNSRFGQALQVRPKAANSKILTDAIGSDGEVIKTLPRGFYLRSNFTHSILKSLSY